MAVAVITGSSGLVGSEAALYFAELGFDVVGIDNDMRRRFFGAAASTAWNRTRLERSLGARYTHLDVDVRDAAAIDAVFSRYGIDIELVVHAAAQPSHDWAAQDPVTDFSVNATGTLNLLEATRTRAPSAVFIFTSTNKVYGDNPNRLPLIEMETRWEIDPAHAYVNGVPESMSIDRTMHSVFGASKVSADVLVQEYGRYFGLRTVSFRGGCLTGPAHSGAELHGFLSYLVRRTMTGEPYTVFGYGGKQVRDNIHSADLVRAFHEFYKAPRVGEVYNIGGGRFSNCSVIEAIALTQKITGRELSWTYTEVNRPGDHVWWISDMSRFSSHYPEWTREYDIEQIIASIYEGSADALPGQVAHA